METKLDLEVIDMLTMILTGRPGLSTYTRRSILMSGDGDGRAANAAHGGPEVHLFLTSGFSLRRKRGTRRGGRDRGFDGWRCSGVG